MTDFDETDTYRVLECATLSSGLNSALIWDSSFSRIANLATAWGQMIETAYGNQAERIILSPAETDENLWGKWVPGTECLCWMDGLLARRTKCIPIFVIPDLGALELPCRRALLLAMAEDVVHLERDGQSKSWKPNSFWLAGCRTADAGLVSPHLLDRFALRLKQPDLREADLLPSLRDALQHGSTVSATPVRTKLAQTAREIPRITDRAMSAILDFVPQLGVGSRRALTLARLATGLARLEGSHEVDLEQVQAAAQLIAGPLYLKQDPIQQGNKFASEMLQKGRDDSSDHLGDIQNYLTPLPQIEKSPLPNQNKSDSAGQESVKLVRTRDESALAANQLASSIGQLYGEDAAAITRESYSLRLGPLLRGRKTMPRGPIIGSLPASDLRDISVTATLIEAAKFQMIRQGAAGEIEGLQIRAADLRKHRRSPNPDRLLLLVIDYTAVDALPWHNTLVPALQQAYAQRAAITIVQIGAADAPQPLRANVVRAKSLLSPAVERALSAQSGAASPLAHGLDLATDILRGCLHRGRDSNIEANVIIYTDARGNVTREASLSGKMTEPIGRKGIDDALLAARELGKINRQNCLVISPRLMAYRQLPEQLAAEMKARIAYLPSEFAEEADE